MKTIYTFSIQTIDDLDNVWLCAIDTNAETVIPLALFIDDKQKLFTEILNSGLMVAHAKGGLGI